MWECVYIVGIIVLTIAVVKYDIDAVITKSGWFQLGTYRNNFYERNVALLYLIIGCWPSVFVLSTLFFLVYLLGFIINWAFFEDRPWWVTLLFVLLCLILPRVFD